MRPRVVGPVLAKLSLALVYGLSAFTLGGLFYFNYSDVGIVNAIKMFWKL
jgi:succinate dehydrogenase (ubiquinone) membrane anchor subunit